MADNVFTGKNGTLTLIADTTPPGLEGKDAGAVLSAYNNKSTSPAIARVTNVEVYVQTGLEEFHEVGTRKAISLHPGDIHVHGKIGRAYVNGQLLFLLLGKGAAANKQTEPYVQPVFQLKLDLNDPANPGQVELIVDGVKLQNWVATVPEESFVMENVTFMGLDIHVVDAGLTPSF
jgi:hypothetical protein